MMKLEITKESSMEDIEMFCKRYSDGKKVPHSIIADIYNTFHNDGIIKYDSELYRVFSHDYTHLSFFMGFDLRTQYIQQFGFLGLCDKMLDKLAETIKRITYKEHPVVLEIGAGHGYLSKHLMERGIKCTPNEYKLDDNTYFKNMEPILAKEIYNTMSGIEAVKTCDYDLVLSSWAPYEDSLLHDVLVAMNERDKEEYEHRPLLAFTEGECGCIADDSFFDISEETPSEYIDDINDCHFNWYGIHDRLRLYRYKRKDF